MIKNLYIFFISIVNNQNNLCKVLLRFTDYSYKDIEQNQYFVYLLDN